MDCGPRTVYELIPGRGAEVIASGAEDGVGSIAGAALELAAEMVRRSPVADDGFDGCSIPSSRLMAPKTPGFCLDEDACPDEDAA